MLRTRRSNQQRDIPDCSPVYKKLLTVLLRTRLEYSNGAYEQAKRMPVIQPSFRFSRVTCAARLCADHPADLLHDGFRVGELVALPLGVDERPVDHDLENPAARRDECQRGDRVLVLMEQCVRQTDGLIEVPSRGAVFDGNSHFFRHHGAPS